MFIVIWSKYTLIWRTEGITYETRSCQRQNYAFAGKIGLLKDKLEKCKFMKNMLMKSVLLMRKKVVAWGQKVMILAQKLLLGVKSSCLGSKVKNYGSKVGTWGQKLRNTVQKLVH